MGFRLVHSLFATRRNRAAARLSLLFVILCQSCSSITVAALSERDVAFVQGNIQFIFMHELAHVLIADLDIPILGPQENAADYLATYFLIRGSALDAEQAERARLFIGAVANGFATEWELNRPALSELPFWDSHALGIQRFFHIGCLLYGSSPSTFPNLPSRIGLPDARAAQCEAEFRKLDQSIGWMEQSFGNSGNAASAEVTYHYDKAPSSVSMRIVASMREVRLLENAVAGIQKRFPFAAPINVGVRRCASPHASWSASDRTITICYELIDRYYLLARNPGARARDKLLDSTSD